MQARARNQICWLECDCLVETAHSTMANTLHQVRSFTTFGNLWTHYWRQMHYYKHTFLIQCTRRCTMARKLLETIFAMFGDILLQYVGGTTLLPKKAIKWFLELEPTFSSPAPSLGVQGGRRVSSLNLSSKNNSAMEGNQLQIWY